MSNRWVKTVLPAAVVAALGLSVTVGCEKKEEKKPTTPTKPTTETKPETKPEEKK